MDQSVRLVPTQKHGRSLAGVADYGDGPRSPSGFASFPQVPQQRCPLENPLSCPPSSGDVLRGLPLHHKAEGLDFDLRARFGRGQERINVDIPDASQTATSKHPSSLKLVPDGNDRHGQGQDTTAVVPVAGGLL